MKNLTISELAASGNKYAVVAFDETNNWRTSIKAKAGKIEGVYLLILDEPTYCCEITPSYYGVFLRNVFENPNFGTEEGLNEDELTEMERDNGGEEGHYFHHSSTPKFVKFYTDEAEQYEILEYEMCNPSYC